MIKRFMTPFLAGWVLAVSALLFSAERARADQEESPWCNESGALGVNFCCDCWLEGSVVKCAKIWGAPGLTSCHAGAYGNGGYCPPFTEPYICVSP